MCGWVTLNEESSNDGLRCIVKSLIATSTYFWLKYNRKKRKLELCFLGTRVWGPQPKLVYQSLKPSEYVTEITLL